MTEHPPEAQARAATGTLREIARDDRVTDGQRRAAENMANLADVLAESIRVCREAGLVDEVDGYHLVTDGGSYYGRDQTQLPDHPEEPTAHLAAEVEERLADLEREVDRARGTRTDLVQMLSDLEEDVKDLRETVATLERRVEHLEGAANEQ